jgi:hypothetical protein
VDPIAVQAVNMMALEARGQVTGHHTAPTTSRGKGGGIDRTERRIETAVSSGGIPPDHYFIGLFREGSMSVKSELTRVWRKGTSTHRL